MSPTQIIFPNHQRITVPEASVAAIAESSANYTTPLWSNRAERVLKLGAHQWIDPTDPTDAQQRFAVQQAALHCTAWKLFNRSWQEAADAYFREESSYPNHPRHLGEGVIPLVDEDLQLSTGTEATGQQVAAQIGWVRIEQVTEINAQFVIFIAFTLLDLFAARPLPQEYH